jgi:hypothetical protein
MNCSQQIYSLLKPNQTCKISSLNINSTRRRREYSAGACYGLTDLSISVEDEGEYEEGEPAEGAYEEQ